MSEQNNIIIERLESTVKMTHALLTELKETETEFAVVKTELGILRDNVKGLSEIIREGNGSTSILTRLALIEQKMFSIEKWMENHIDIHQRSTSEIISIKNDIDEMDRKNEYLEKDVLDIKNELLETEKQKRQSLSRELELHHDKYKNDQKMKAEQQSAITKIIIAVLLAVITALGGFLANSCNSLTLKNNEEIKKN